MAPAASAEQAHQLLQAGMYAEAIKLAQRIVVDDPGNADALAVIANALAKQARYAEAAEIAVQLADLVKSDPVTQLLFAFEWHLRAGDPTAAEQVLVTATQLAPQDSRGFRTLAQLLNAQGRRSETTEPLVALEQLGGMEYLEAMSLIDLGEPFRLTEFGELIEPIKRSLFELGKARKAYATDNNGGMALQTVDSLADTDADTAAVKAFRGRLIAETTDGSRFEDWFKRLPSDVQTQPEYWFAVGTWLTQQQREREAVRAYGEAIRLDPTDRRSLTSMAVLLDRLGERDRAVHVKETLGTLNAIVRQAKDADAQESMWIADRLQRLVRPWESVAWYRHALELQGQLEQRRGELEQRRAQIQSWEQAASKEQIREARLKVLLGFDVTEFPMPDFAKLSPLPMISNNMVAGEPLRFRDVADSVGVVTTFVSDYPESGIDFFLHQTNGGGIAVLDVDLDGLADLYFVQSGGDPKKPGDSVANQLYRQLPSGKFGDVSTASSAADRGFGQGACAADINQDGFPDLLVANIGKNCLYINQGDGTFSNQSHWIADNQDRWTSSIAVGDLDGDSLPDLFEVNYVDDETIFERRCRGVESFCAPQRFRGAKNRLLKNRGDGQLEPWDQVPNDTILPNYGFGAVIANFDGLAGNDVFVSNDGDLNHFWKSEPGTGATERFKIREVASVSGCSVGRSGYAQACMGITSGDFDQNGFLDLFVTNFHKEPVNLFLQNEAGFFVDDARQYGLVEPSMSMLGFGTQAADFDNDGWLDVAVLNGHIYNASQLGVPFKMPAQLFRGGQGQFVLQDAATAGPYWQREQLGRTLAMLDFNRDGRTDLVANHLDQPVAILENDCRAQQWLEIELVGVASERAAVGARIVVTAGGRKWTAWRSGGDGYMCTSEPVVHVGIGTALKIDSIEVFWPAGSTQKFGSIEPNHRYLAIEGDDLLYKRW